MSKPILEYGEWWVRDVETGETCRIVGCGSPQDAAEAAAEGFDDDETESYDLELEAWDGQRYSVHVRVHLRTVYRPGPVTKLPATPRG